jgi:hypothetical protein
MGKPLMMHEEDERRSEPQAALGIKRKVDLLRAGIDSERKSNAANESCVGSERPPSWRQRVGK